MNDLKRKLRVDDVRRGGNDGFVCLSTPCSCGVEDPWPCGYGPYPECVTAKAVEVADEYEASLCDSMPGDIIFVQAHRASNWYC